MKQDNGGDLRVGELNGKWSVLFRVALGAMPILIAWAGFVTVTIYDIREDMEASHRQYEVWMARTDGSRFTQSDWARELNLMRRENPPEWVRQKLDAIALEQRRLQVSIDRLEGHKTGSYVNE